MFTIGYTMAFALPLAGGVVSDASGSLRVPLAPALLGGILALLASASFRSGRASTAAARRAPGGASVPGPPEPAEG
jgi:cyanate permease